MKMLDKICINAMLRANVAIHITTKTPSRIYNFLVRFICPSPLHNNRNTNSQINNREYSNHDKLQN
mgnify:CR=1 FL=1